MAILPELFIEGLVVGLVNGAITTVGAYVHGLNVASTRVTDAD